MIMNSKPAEVDRITSNAWVAELIRKDGELKGSADPTVFADAEDDIDIRIPSGDAALRVASTDSSRGDRMRSASLRSAATSLPPAAFFRSADRVYSGDSISPSVLLAAAASRSASAASLSARIPSDWLLRQASLSQSHNLSPLSPLASLTGQRSTSIDLLSRIGLLQSATMNSDLMFLQSLDAAIAASATLSPVSSASLLPTLPLPLSSQLRAASTQMRLAAAAQTAANRAAATQREAAASLKPETKENQILGDDQIEQYDVLSGRGGKSNHHQGNKRFRQVVNEMKLKYRGSDHKNDKTALANAIVQYVKGYGARFLKKEGSNKWRVMTKNEARKKTSQALRETKELKWTI